MRPFTLLFVTHDRQLIEEYADDVLHIQAGQVAYFGPKSGYQDTQILPPMHTHPGKSPRVYPNLEVRDVSISYGPREVFSAFNWSSHGHGWWWLNGPNGSGKSTLTKAIAGLVQPDSGHLLLEGVEVAWPIKARAEHSIQYAFQLGLDLFNPARRMGSQLNAFFRGNSGSLGRWMQKAGLSERLLQSFPGKLSLGEKQRFNLIRALASQPRVLIVDEGLSSLDRDRQVQMIRFLEEIQRETAVLILVVTHDSSLFKLHPGPALELSELDPAPL